MEIYVPQAETDIHTQARMGGLSANLNPLPNAESSCQPGQVIKFVDKRGFTALDVHLCPGSLDLTELSINLEPYLIPGTTQDTINQVMSALVDCYYVDSDGHYHTKPWESSWGFIKTSGGDTLKFSLNPDGTINLVGFNGGFNPIPQDELINILNGMSLSDVAVSQTTVTPDDGVVVYETQLPTQPIPTETPIVVPTQMGTPTIAPVVEIPSQSMPGLSNTSTTSTEDFDVEVLFNNKPALMAAICGLPFLGLLGWLAAMRLQTRFSVQEPAYSDGGFFMRGKRIVNVDRIQADPNDIGYYLARAVGDEPLNPDTPHIVGGTMTNAGMPRELVRRIKAGETLQGVCDGHLVHYSPSEFPESKFRIPITTTGPGMVTAFIQMDEEGVNVGNMGPDHAFHISDKGYLSAKRGLSPNDFVSNLARTLARYFGIIDPKLGSMAAASAVDVYNGLTGAEVTHNEPISKANGSIMTEMIKGSSSGRASGLENARTEVIRNHVIREITAGRHGHGRRSR